MSQQLEASSATLDLPSTAGFGSWDGPRCEMCETPLAPDQLVCRTCGYYASLGIHVEIDSKWEAVAGGEQDARPKETSLQTIHRVIPAWAWWLIALNIAIVAGCIALRLLLPPEELIRTYVSVSLFLVGLVTVVACHAACFVMASITDVDLGLADMVVKPLKGWARTFSQLPRRLWLVIGASGGTTSALGAALIVGGIPFHVLLDWNIKQPPKQNLMGAVMAQVQKVPEGEKKDLEEAVGDLVGKAGGAPMKLDPAKTQPAKPRMNADCLIIGYNLDDRENISQLLLASDHKGRLVYCGHVRPRLEPEEERKLRDRLRDFPRSKSFVPTDKQAVWIQPRFTCRVTFEEVTEKGYLTKIEWDSLLSELKVGW